MCWKSENSPDAPIRVHSPTLQDVKNVAAKISVNTAAGTGQWGVCIWSGDASSKGQQLERLVQYVAAVNLHVHRNSVGLRSEYLRTNGGC